MKRQMFLSASIPIKGRVPFDGDIQTKRIRDAVLALVTVCKDRDMELVFGGHPAISPLVHHAAESLGVIDSIWIYQSRFYEHLMPEEAKKFRRLIFTPKEGDRLESERTMREQMLDPHRWNYQIAFFVGGMEGVFIEAGMFGTKYPNSPMIPLRETGGAARLMEPSQNPDFQKTFPLGIIVEPKEKDATSALRYRRLLSECIDNPPAVTNR